MKIKCFTYEALAVNEAGDPFDFTYLYETVKRFCNGLPCELFEQI